MPRTRSLKWSELKIGIMAVVALVIAATLILALSGEGGFFWQRYNLKVRFPNAGGVQKGSPVRVGGVAVGSVTEMRFVGADVEMDLELNEAMEDKVRTTSRATVGAVSLLGEGAVDITASTTGDPIPEYGYVPIGPAAGQLSDVTAQVSQLGEALTSIVKDIQAGKGTAGKFITDERLYTDLQEMTAAARQVTMGLQQGRGTLGQLLNNPESARQLEASLRNLSGITAKINSGQGSLGQLMNDPAFARNLTNTTSNAEVLTNRLNQGQGTMGKLLNDEALYQRLNAVTTNLERLTSNLNDGQGTMGQLLKDKQLYDNLNKTVAEMQGLLAEIKKDPKKYLNFRMSIF